MGIQNFIEQQLHPETIDDAKCDAEVAQYEMLQMSTADLVKLYYDEFKKRRQEQKRLAAQQNAADGAAPARCKTARPARGRMARR